MVNLIFLFSRSGSMINKESIMDTVLPTTENYYKTDDIIFLAKFNEMLLTADTEEVFDKLCLLISKYIKVRDLQIYHFNLKNKTFRLKIYLGREEDLEHDFYLERKPLLAHALFHSQAVRPPGDNSTLYMFIKVNNVPIGFIQLNVEPNPGITSDTIRLLESLVNFAGKTLEQNQPVAHLHSVSPGARILDRASFERRVNVERRREKTFGMKHTILKYHLEHKEFDFFRDVIASCVRETDYIAYDYHERLLLLLFPCSSEKKVESIERRVTEHFKAFKIQYR